MRDRAEFMQELKALLETAKKCGGSVSIDEVREHFGEEALTDEQMNLVFDYLLAQKIVVKGYWKNEEKSPLALTEEEQGYLKDYEKDLQAIRPEEDGERALLFGQAAKGDTAAKGRLVEIYLKEVVEIAREMNHEDIFLGDLIQEGNLGAVLGAERIADKQTGHDVMRSQIRQSMQLLIGEQEEQKSRDRKMVEKVNALDEAITELTEELGRKVTIEELALHMGMTEEEIDDIIQLTGEGHDHEEEDTKE